MPYKSMHCDPKEIEKASQNHRASSIHSSRVFQGWTGVANATGGMVRVNSTLTRRPACHCPLCAHRTKASTQACLAHFEILL